MTCPNCGGDIIGDGYTEVRHCEFSNLDTYEDHEPDSSVVYCSKTEFKVGDIVFHKSGRICNGKYGEIIIDYEGELAVLDNEGALDMPVKGNEDDLTIVGNTKDNPELLRTWYDGRSKIMPENIDYKKLLEACMDNWLESEGCCLDGEFNEDLTEEEKKAVKEVHDKAWKKFNDKMKE